MNEITKMQTELIKDYFSTFRVIKRVDDRKVISGIIYVLKNELKWCDEPREFDSHKTIYKRFVRWSKMGIFNNILKSLFKIEHPLPNSCKPTQLILKHIER